MDRGFVHHQAVARMWVAAATELADAVVLPFDIKSYASFLNDSLTSLEKQYGAQLQENGATFSLEKFTSCVRHAMILLCFIFLLEYFRASVDNFSVATQNFTDTLANLDVTDVLAVRRANDRLIQLERFFIDPKGLPDRPETKFEIELCGQLYRDANLFIYHAIQSCRIFNQRQRRLWS